VGGRLPHGDGDNGTGELIAGDEFQGTLLSFLS
jgi:hypothetical protein